jgi:zinc and cadmium transporter
MELDHTFFWILGSGLLMSAIALVGSVTLVLREQTLQRILLPLVAFAAGSLLGGALFHMLPLALAQIESPGPVFLTAAAGFVVFLALEQFMHWHHCHRDLMDHVEPSTYLILIADGLHNFLGGLAVGGVFLVDVQLGIMAWLAAAMHEVPQELGDFGVLMHGGWKKASALWFNLISGLTFLLGGLVVYFASIRFQINTDYLIAFGAGNFLYIGASDLIPQINKEETLANNLLHFAALVAGLALLYGLSRF